MAMAAVVVANDGRGWWYEAAQGGRLGPEVQPSPLPTLLEQHDSAESSAGGASEWFGMDSTYTKTVSSKFTWCSNVWISPGASPRPFEPNRLSNCSSAARKPCLRLVRHKAIWPQLKVRTPVYEDPESGYDIIFLMYPVELVAQRCVAAFRPGRVLGAYVFYCMRYRWATDMVFQLHTSTTKRNSQMPP